MRPRACRSLAIVSVVAIAALAATRPRYGGTLRVQLAGALPSFGRTERHWSLRDRALFGLIAETLTCVNARGEAEPLLATSWQSNSEKTRWRFVLRRGVVFHDGSALTPVTAAAALNFNAEITSYAQGIQISLDHPMPDLPLRVADPSSALLRDGAIVNGTGPFQVSDEPGHVVLKAFEQHWAGRPFLDAVDLTLSASRADAWEIPLGVSRRSTPQGTQVWTSAPAELIAIEIEPPEPKLAAALSASLDRQPMAAVLTQKRAEATAAILPQWVSGYSFVFPIGRDLPRALALAPKPAPTVLTYDGADALARIVAERVAVNARDAGIVITARPDTISPMRMRRFYAGPNTTEIGLPTSVAADPEDMYVAERTLLESGKLVPLMHVPLVFGFASKIHLPSATAPVLPRLPLDGAWILP